MTVKEIISKAGGPKAVAEALGGSVKVDAVYKWPSIGIPDRHWKRIMELAEGVTAQDLFDANLMARAEVAA